MDILPPEIIRTLLEYLSNIQKRSISRVCKLWAYLVKTFKIHSIKFGKNVPEFEIYDMNLPIPSHVLITNETSLKRYDTIQNKNSLLIIHTTIGNKNSFIVTHNPISLVVNRVTTQNSLQCILENSNVTHAKIYNNYQLEQLRSSTLSPNLQYLKLDRYILDSLPSNLISLNISRCMGTSRYSSCSFISLPSILMHNSMLLRLNISYNNLSKEQVKSFINALKVNTTLTHINLSGNKIFNKEAFQISSMLKINKTIRFLKLNDTFIHRLGSKALAKIISYHPTLMGLSMNNTYIKNGGVIDLAKMLMTNTTLTYLDISLCKKVFYSAGCLIADSIIANTTLRTLKFNTDYIGWIARARIRQALIHNTLISFNE